MMFFSGMVLALGLDQAITQRRAGELLRQGDEGIREARAVMADSRKVLQELERIRAEVERTLAWSERLDREYADFLRKYGPLMPRKEAEMLYKGAEEICKKYGVPPLPPLPPPDKK